MTQTPWYRRIWPDRLKSGLAKAARPARGIHASVKVAGAAWSGLGHRHRGQVVFALVVVPLLVLGGLTAGSMYWSSQPSFCARCHPMRPYIAGWQASKHSGVGCEECHLPPGTVAFIGGKIAALQVVVDYARGNYRDESFNAVVSNSACLKCHAKVETTMIVTDGIRVDHKGIIALGAKCMACHSTVAHGNSVAIGARTYPTMSACFTCHNGQVASTACTVCHVKGDWRLPPPVTGTKVKGS